MNHFGLSPRYHHLKFFVAQFWGPDSIESSGTVGSFLINGAVKTASSFARKLDRFISYLYGFFLSARQNMNQRQNIIKKSTASISIDYFRLRAAKFIPIKLKLQCIFQDSHFCNYIKNFFVTRIFIIKLQRVVMNFIRDLIELVNKRLKVSISLKFCNKDWWCLFHNLNIIKRTVPYGRPCTLSRFTERPQLRGTITQLSTVRRDPFINDNLNI